MNDSFFLRRLGKGDSAKSMVAMLPAAAPPLTPRSSHRSETEGSDSAIHCQVHPSLRNCLSMRVQGSVHAASRQTWYTATSCQAPALQHGQDGENTLPTTHKLSLPVCT